MNLLLVTLDQFRGECLSAAGHGVARTPNLDRLAAAGVRLDRHYSQAAPCSPGRACLYTGTYQMNNRVVANGTPLDDRLDNLARAARRGGLEPTLFGYTDQGVDPRTVSPGDPRLSSYEGVLPGFTVGLDLTGENARWLEWLGDLGYDVPPRGREALATEPERPEEVGISAFMTDRYLEWLERQERPWFAHLSYLRPHPPYAAAGRWASAFDPDEVDMPIAPASDRHPFHEAALRLPQAAAPTDERSLRRIRAQYYGMIGDVDAQLGRVFDALERLGQWEDTFVLVTLGSRRAARRPRADGEARLLRGELPHPGHRSRSSSPGGPGHGGQCRSPRTSTSSRRSARPSGSTCPSNATGSRSRRFSRVAPRRGGGRRPPGSSTGDTYGLPAGAYDWPWDRRLERENLTVQRFEDGAYVQFGDGSLACYDLEADPTWRTEVEDPSRILGYAQSMLTWRAEHADRNLTSFLLEDGGIGRWPAGPYVARAS